MSAAVTLYSIIGGLALVYLIFILKKCTFFTGIRRFRMSALLSLYSDFLHIKSV